MFDFRHEVIHLHSHLCCDDRVGRDELDALACRSLAGILLDDSAVCDCVTIGELKDGCLSPIDCYMPWLLVVEIDRALLELDALCCKRIPAPS